MNKQDNQQLRALLSLPPIQPSASTAVVAPEMPPQETVTGDREVDAVLWLQKVVATGNQALIDKALEAARLIKTPMGDLGKRYAVHIARKTGNAFGAALSSFRFGELEDQAKRAIERAARRHEALSRFGNEETLFADTPAETACIAALRRVKRGKHFGYDDAAVAIRFAKHPALVPATIDDCLYAIAYWDALYWLRAATGEHGDAAEQATAHRYYCRDMLARIHPRNAAEALAVLSHLDEDVQDWGTAQPIIRNLIESAWASPWIFSHDAQPDVGVEVITLDMFPGDTFPGRKTYDIDTATREEGMDWTAPDAVFWWMYIPEFPAHPDQEVSAS